MKPAFIFVPTTDLAALAAFYGDTLHLDEAWREGDDTVAFALPDSDVQLMVSSSPGRQGPMYQVESLSEWMRRHDGLEIAVPLEEIPGGAVVGYTDPAGNAFYVFDQAG
jgi:predicted enzyme related to lactoylglutathione lyase